MKRLLALGAIALVIFGLSKLQKSEEETPAPLAWDGGGLYNADSLRKLANRVEAAGYSCEGRSAKRLGRLSTGDVATVITCAEGRFAHMELASGGVAIMTCEKAAASGLSCDDMQLLTN